VSGIFYQLLVTFCLGILATITGAIIAFFASLLCAKNVANPKVAAVVKSVVALIRAVPTILWVLIFAVSAGLGSVAAVAGLTFHSAGYLTKAYAESIEEMDFGTIEALKANGLIFWQIVFQAIMPSSSAICWHGLSCALRSFYECHSHGRGGGRRRDRLQPLHGGSFYLDLREMGL
jgi:phosphonate transport system permease protein